MTDIDNLPAMLYGLGEDAIDVAIEAARTHIWVRDEVLAGRAEDPNAFPGYGEDDATTIAARIVGDLLGAGWTPPSEEAVKAAAASSQAKTARFEAWLGSLTTVQRNYAMDYYAKNGEFPDDCRPPKAEQERIANGDDEPPALEAS